MLQTEGAYPYVRSGGVSTWAEILCDGLDSEVDFDLYCLVDHPDIELKYDLPRNIRHITKVPLWGSEMPAANCRPARDFRSIARLKENLDETALEEQFIPLFRDFLACLFRPLACDPEQVGELLYGLWRYFRRHDYKNTLRHVQTWEIFNRQLSHHYRTALPEQATGEFNLLNATMGLRRLYHFLMPLNVSVPHVDVSHSSSAGFPALPSLLGKFEYGTPYLVTDHGIWLRERIKALDEDKAFGLHARTLLSNLCIVISKAAYRHADLLTPVTGTHSGWLKEFGAREDRIHPIINGVDVEKFRPMEEAGGESERPTVVALANLVELKDIKTMIRTCDVVRESVPTVRFLLYGNDRADPEYTRRCEALIEELNLSEHFIIGGFHNSPAEAFNEGDLSILTSVSEGAPYTVLESMACGRPVVATDVGGVREVLGECGRVNEPGDVEGLAASVVELLENDSLREEFGARSRRHAVNRYSARITLENYHRRYLEQKNALRTPLKKELRHPVVRKLAT
ncbi:MAG: GT4 family glycosyltransferase PelF [Balneolaceae bacterium]|nr:GT4 family glycosyltransferase PelF [Balneolaceae bacterium]